MTGGKFENGFPLRYQNHVGIDNQSIRTLVGDRLERCRKIRPLPHFVPLKADAEARRGFAYRLNEVPAGAIQWIPQYGNLCGVRHELVEKLHQFPTVFRYHLREAGDVSARPRETGDQA
jgi:hypothetical protein